ncbi:collagen alpha-1(I) chain-like [Muntiacus reevesi]|uniref:collagen alpha-1(I) chain-like n=1 Tax=Muntiacus reevesi TaxID=9886 RepID=UPI003307330E
MARAAAGGRAQRGRGPRQRSVHSCGAAGAAQAPSPSPQEPGRLPREKAREQLDLGAPPEIPGQPPAAHPRQAGTGPRMTHRAPALPEGGGQPRHPFPGNPGSAETALLAQPAGSILESRELPRGPARSHRWAPHWECSRGAGALGGGPPPSSPRPRLRVRAGRSSAPPAASSHARSQPAPPPAGGGTGSPVPSPPSSRPELPYRGSRCARPVVAAGHGDRKPEAVAAGGGHPVTQGRREEAGPPTNRGVPAACGVSQPPRTSPTEPLLPTRHVLASGSQRRPAAEQGPTEPPGAASGHTVSPSSHRREGAGSPLEGLPGPVPGPGDLCPPTSEPPASCRPPAILLALSQPLPGKLRWQCVAHTGSLTRPGPLPRPRAPGPADPGRHHDSGELKLDCPGPPPGAPAPVCGCWLTREPGCLAQKGLGTPKPSPLVSTSRTANLQGVPITFCTRGTQASRHLGPSWSHPPAVHRWPGAPSRPGPLSRSQRAPAPRAPICLRLLRAQPWPHRLPGVGQTRPSSAQQSTRGAPGAGGLEAAAASRPSDRKSAWALCRTLLGISAPSHRRGFVYTRPEGGRPPRARWTERLAASTQLPTPAPEDRAGRASVSENLTLCPIAPRLPEPREPGASCCPACAHGRGLKALWSREAVPRAAAHPGVRVTPHLQDLRPHRAGGREPEGGNADICLTEGAWPLSKPTSRAVTPALPGGARGGLFSPALQGRQPEELGQRSLPPPGPPGVQLQSPSGCRPAIPPPGPQGVQPLLSEPEDRMGGSRVAPACLCLAHPEAISLPGDGWLDRRGRQLRLEQQKDPPCAAGSHTPVLQERARAGTIWKSAPGTAGGQPPSTQPLPRPVRILWLPRPGGPPMTGGRIRQIGRGRKPSEWIQTRTFGCSGLAISAAPEAAHGPRELRPPRGQTGGHPGTCTSQAHMRKEACEPTHTHLAKVLSPAGRVRGVLRFPKALKREAGSAQNTVCSKGTGQWSKRHPGPGRARGPPEDPGGARRSGHLRMGPGPPGHSLSSPPQKEEPLTPPHLPGLLCAQELSILGPGPETPGAARLGLAPPHPSPGHPEPSPSRVATVPASPASAQGGPGGPPERSPPRPPPGPVPATSAHRTRPRSAGAQLRPSPRPRRSDAVRSPSLPRTPGRSGARPVEVPTRGGRPPRSGRPLRPPRARRGPGARAHHGAPAPAAGAARSSPYSSPPALRAFRSSPGTVRRSPRSAPDRAGEPAARPSRRRRADPSPRTGCRSGGKRRSGRAPEGGDLRRPRSRPDDPGRPPATPDRGPPLTCCLRAGARGLGVAGAPSPPAGAPRRRLLAPRGPRPAPPPARPAVRGAWGASCGGSCPPRALHAPGSRVRSGHLPRPLRRLSRPGAQARTRSPPARSPRSPCRQREVPRACCPRPFPRRPLRKEKAQPQTRVLGLVPSLAGASRVWPAVRWSKIGL